MPSLEDQNLIGKILNDRYRLDAVLGRGGMGVVYCAHDTLIEREVAVKVLAGGNLGTEGQVRLLQEARAAGRLNHPNIVTIFDVGEETDHAFIVMELIDGPSLFDHQPANLTAIIKIAQQVCAALEHAHAAGIVHRDVKPENVILDKAGNVKLMDFGIARSPASRLTAEGVLLGTVHYMPPEQALGEAVDGRSDLYSFGVMLYEMVTGRLPFEAQEPLEIITQHLHAPMVPPRATKPTIPGELDRLILSLLEKRPDDRPDSASFVLKTLDNLIDMPLEEAERAEALQQPEVPLLERIVRGRMVGRERELAEARAMWMKAVRGEGQVLLVSGEPGIGKTRLVDELVAQSHVTGGRSLIGDSYAEGGPPYNPFRQIIRKAIGSDGRKIQQLPEDAMVSLLKLVPELRGDFPNLQVTETDDPRYEQQKLMESILFLFTSLCRESPVLLVLEDVHWADSGTISLLRYLGRETRQNRLLITATYREVELDEARPLHEMLMDFNREKIGKRIKLSRLDRQETEQMLEILFAEEIRHDFLEGIYRETEGNPFFIEEVAKALVESGKLTFQGGRWQRPSMAELGVPQSIQVAIQSRFQKLAEGTQKTLEQAAVLGRTFQTKTLLRATDQSEDELIEALEEAEHAQLIEALDTNRDEQFAFTHAMIPTALLSGIRRLRRRRLNRLAAQALEDLQPNEIESLANLYLEAGEIEKGLEYLLRVADRARAIYAYQEAIDGYEQALEILRDQDPERAARTLLKLGLAYHNASDFKAARGAYQEGFKLWQQAEDAQKYQNLPPAPHPLRGVMPELGSLDVMAIGSGWDNHIIDNIFSALVELNPDLEIVPDAAQRWEVLDGGRRYIFHLRQDATWSDGVPVTADDFEFAWKRVLDPASGADAEAINYFQHIKNALPFHEGKLSDPSAVGIRSRDDFTLEIDLENPSGSFLYGLSIYNSYPVPRHTLQKFGDAWAEPENIVVNGPFKPAEWKTGEYLVLETNPAYHGVRTGNLQRVKMIFESSLGDVDALDLYEADRLDFLFRSQTRAHQRHPEEFRSNPFLMTAFISLDTRIAPLDDQRVRQALAMALDRERLIGEIYDGTQHPADGGYLPPGMPGYTEGIALPYDPQQARRLLAQAGYPDGRGFPKMIYLASIEGPPSQFEIFLREQWRENLGIELARKELARKRAFRMFSEIVQERLKQDKPNLWGAQRFAEAPDPSILLNEILTTETGWQNDAFKELLERARVTLAPDVRAGLYRQADAIVASELPIIPVYYGQFNLLLKPWVRRFPLSPTRGWHWKYVLIEPQP